jgi:hypothetical protein
VVLKPPKGALEATGDVAMAVCVHDDTAALGEPAAVCKMMTMTMKLGKERLPLRYGETKKLIYQSVRTADPLAVSTATDSDVDVLQ